MAASDASAVITDVVRDAPQIAVADVADMPVSRKAVRSRGERAGRALRATLPPLAVFVVIIAIWYGAHAILGAGRAFLVPTPDEVLTQGFFGPSGGQIIIAVFRTTGVAVTGLVIAAALGIAWATAMALAKWVQRSTYPYAVILQCIPILALVPLIGVWFGYEFTARVVVCVMIALFPMVANTLFGLQSVDRSQHELFRLQKADRWTVLSKLMFPAALPSIFLGLRTSAGLSVVGAIVGDFFFQRGTPGVGTLLQTYARLLSYPQLFAAIITSALLGVAMFFIFGLLSRLAVGKWYDPVN
ncbi:ABC transporter permease [Lysinimonas soli]|uniref:ABC transporter permease n=1 Tax=Lysinimonas soli TaxID=1074233 RepID=A0ABW0NS32_9MICO